ncbi:MAG: hypothetical protein K6E36_12515 [Oscillospiraceae bacterium]|nr:hypothetical protein [Oscillospiraceae bacterium]
MMKNKRTFSGRLLRGAAGSALSAVLFSALPVLKADAAAGRNAQQTKIIIGTPMTVIRRCFPFSLFFNALKSNPLSAMILNLRFIDKGQYVLRLL